MYKIANFLEIVKRYEVEIILAIGVVLISLLSFAAGYLTAKEQLKEPIQIQTSQIPSLNAQENSNE